MRKKDSEISNMQKRLLESEVYVRNRNVEIHGVIEESEEDVEEIVCKTALALGVEINKEEINAAHRVHSRNQTAPRPIVAQLVSRKMRDAILSSRRKPVYNDQVTRGKKGS